MISLVIAAILLAINFALTKYYQQDGNDSQSELMMFNTVVAAFSAILFFIVTGFSLHINIFTFLMALIFAFLVVAYRMIGFKIMEQEKMALYTVFLMAGGMILPYIWGLLFLGEDFSLLRTIGIILIILSMVISNLDSEKISIKTTVMYLLVFVLNGFTSIVSKEHQISELSSGTMAFSITKDLITVAACFLIAKIMEKKETQTKIKKFSLKKNIILLLVALTSGVSFFLQLKGAEQIPATVLYPVITGGTVIFTALAGWICFKETITKRIAVSLILCFAGTCMFL